MRHRASLAGRLFVRPFVILCTLVGILAVAAPAQAIQSHALDAVHSPFGAFNTPIGIAVDSSTNPADTSAGDVYVNDNKNNRVLKFDKNGIQIGGNFLAGIAGLAWNAVDPANGDLYVSTFGGPVYKYDSAGSPVTSFGDTVGGTDGVLHGRFTNAGAIGARGVALEPVTGDLYVADGSHQKIDIFDPQGKYITEFLAPAELVYDQIAVDGSGNVYVVDEHHSVKEYKPSQNPPAAGTTFDSGTVVDSNGPFAVEVDPSNDELYIVENSTGLIKRFSPSGSLIESFPAPDGGASAGLAVNGVTHTVYATDIGGTTASIYTPQPPTPDATTQPATDLQQHSATLNGHVDLDAAHGGGPVTGCHFEYGTTTTYSLGFVPCLDASGTVAGTPGNPITTATDVHAEAPGLQLDDVYHFRLVAENANGHTNGFDSSFRTLPDSPLIGSESVSNVRSDVAVMHAQVNPNDAVENYATTHDGHAIYHFEYVDDQTFQQDQPNGFEHAASFPVPGADIGFGTSNVVVSQEVGGLIPGAIYHYRAVAQTVGGTTSGPEHLFRTYTTGNPFDRCPNAHVRQQTGAAHLPDCRAYELVSAANAGGYPVESNLVAGQTPFGGYPQAFSPSRVLYAVHAGGIPGTGQPTNRGPDPYLATRGEHGWTTEYVGIPANNPFAAAPFSSTLAEADSNLDAFAFGGETICSPCFEDGSSGIPIHLPNGELVPGLAGPLNPGPSAEPDGYIAKHFSADGRHFIFGSTSKLAEGGNGETGDVSIYDRNLKTGATHVVSNAPGEGPLPCLQGAGSCHSPGDGNGIAELDISSDGSRVLLAQKVSTDADGNVYWHLYMNIGDSVKSIDVTPGVIGGVLYDGMSADGSKVFFTSKDKLSSDTDTSADIYAADVSGPGATVVRVSTGEGGSAGNTDSCTPINDWNTVSGGPNCNAVAIGGGGGVATADGTVYFLSPELLDGGSNGTQDEPNLYVVRPGSAPHFVVTLEPNNPAVLDAVKAVGTRRTSDFQVTPSGDFAAFPSVLPLLPTVDNAGHTQVYRYDASTGVLDCASCSPTLGTDTGDGTLSNLGLGLTNDGRVFFDSTEALAARDEDEKDDVYEWEPLGTGTPQCESASGCPGLISTGVSRFDAKLLSVSADGTDAHFFTRDTLVPQDENGTLTKIYDARAEGGFPYVPPPVPCQASDECHGPSSQAPPPPTINTVTGIATRGNADGGRGPRKPHKHHHKRAVHHKRHAGH